MKVGQYKLGQDQTASIYVAESVFRDSLAGESTVVEPILCEGVDPKKERLEVADFLGDFAKPGTNLRFRISTMGEDGSKSKPRATQFKIKRDRSFSFGSIYKGPVQDQALGTIVRCDRASLEALQYVMRRVNGFEDLLFIDGNVMARLAAQATPPPNAAPVKTYEKLGARPPGRALGADSKATRRSLEDTPSIDGDDAGAPKTKRAETAGVESEERLHPRMTVTVSQKECTIDMQGHIAPANDTLELVRQLQAGLTSQTDEMRTRDILPARRFAAYLNGLPEGTVIETAALLKATTKPMQAPGTAAYERTHKRLQRLIDQINDGSLAEDYDLDAFDYRLTKEVHAGIRGEDIVTGEPLQAQRVSFRKVALEAADEMQVMR